MDEAVEKVRTAGVGTLYPEIMLNDSNKLTDAQLKKIDESGISFLHSGGFQVVPVGNLPPTTRKEIRRCLAGQREKTFRYRDRI
jgi:hypothetical protein